MKFNTNFLKISRELINNILVSRGRVVTNYNDYRLPVLARIRGIKKEGRLVFEYHEAYTLYMAVRSVDKIKGDIAEVGVYTGGSARLICEAKGNKNLYLFDTFTGLPEVGEIDSDFETNQFCASVENVRSYLSKFRNVYIYQGLFPKSSLPIKKKTFSLVHLDVDIYTSTIGSLKFFYHRMVKGGVIISHDYVLADGVRKAFDEFFADKPEPILTMSGSQCIVVKV